MLLIVRRLPICSCYPPVLHSMQDGLHFNRRVQSQGWTFDVDTPGRYTVELHDPVYSPDVVMQDQLVTLDPATRCDAHA